MDKNKIQATSTKLGQKETLKDKVGGALEKAGKSISDMGAEKIGQKIHDMGDKLEDSHKNPNHPRQV